MGKHDGEIAGKRQLQFSQLLKAHDLDGKIQTLEDAKSDLKGAISDYVDNNSDFSKIVTNITPDQWTGTTYTKFGQAASNYSSDYSSYITKVQDCVTQINKKISDLERQRSHCYSLREFLEGEIRSLLNDK
ncbi:YwqH-like family protein [Furfurilactobacillus sp. WILCCON 0119]